LLYGAIYLLVEAIYLLVEAIYLLVEDSAVGRDHDPNAALRIDASGRIGEVFDRIQLSGFADRIGHLLHVVLRRRQPDFQHIFGRVDRVLPGPGRSAPIAPTMARTEFRAHFSAPPSAVVQFRCLVGSPPRSHPCVIEREVEHGRQKTCPRIPVPRRARRAPPGILSRLLLGQSESVYRPTDRGQGFANDLFHEAANFIAFDGKMHLFRTPQESQAASQRPEISCHQNREDQKRMEALDRCDTVSIDLRRRSEFGIAYSR
jgi:hypothetical protein